MEKQNLQYWLENIGHHSVAEYAVQLGDDYAEFEYKEALHARYMEIIQELIDFAPRKTYRDQHELIVMRHTEFGGAEEYFHWSLTNKQYIEPDESLKPWGGDFEDINDAPEGCYNVNHVQNIRSYSMAGIPWRILANLDVNVDMSTDGFSLEEVFGALLYDLTFDGFTEYEAHFGFKKKMDSIQERVGVTSKEDGIPFDEALRELKDFAEDRSPTPPEDPDLPKVYFTPQALEDMKQFIRDDMEKENNES